MTRTTGVTPIDSLEDLPSGWVLESLARVLSVAERLIRPPFSLANMALGVYAWQKDDLPKACNWLTPCPADHTGTHARDAMLPLMVTGYVGGNASVPAVDGLSPNDIRHIKAHSVAYSGMSNWSLHGCFRPGDTRSYGGVIFEIGRADGEVLRFIVAASGDQPWKDQEFAQAVGNAIVADLIEDGYVIPPAPESPTFIIGADPAKVVRFIAAHH